MISVIIPTLWRETLIATIESVDATLKEYDYEIVLIGEDNPMFDELKDNYPVKLILPEDASSIGSKRKIGIENAKYDNIAFLDDDDVWIVKYKKQQFEKYFSSNSKYKLSWGGIRLIKNGKHVGDRIEVPSNPRYDIWYYNFIPTSTIIVSKELIERVGNFDPRFKVMEDWDLNIRMLMFEKTELLPINEIVTTYTINPNKTKQRIKEFADAYELLFSKYEKFSKDRCVYSFHKIRQNIMKGKYFSAIKYIYTPILCPHTIRVFIREFKNMITFG